MSDECAIIDAMDGTSGKALARMSELAKQRRLAGTANELVNAIFDAGQAGALETLTLTQIVVALLAHVVASDRDPAGSVAAIIGQGASAAQGSRIVGTVPHGAAIVQELTSIVSATAQARLS